MRLRFAAVASTLSAMAVKEKPFGSWESPITSKSITAGSVPISGLSVICSSSEDKLYWLEMRPKEGGRYVICEYSPTSPNASERHAIDVSPSDVNVRTRVHEYGGGAFTMDTENGKAVYYSNFSTQQVHKLLLDTSHEETSQTTGKDDQVISPEGNIYRFADGVYDGSRELLFCVREDHTNPAPKDVVNEIVSLTTDGSQVMGAIATGNDFVAAPRLSPDGNLLAYVTWNHPNMPWDATQLKVVKLAEGKDKIVEDSNISSHQTLAGFDGDTSVMQPLWHPVSGDLFFISDESGYYNIYRCQKDENGAFTSSPTNILPMKYDFGGKAPGWSLGQQGFTFLKDGRLIATYTKDGASILLVATVTNNGRATDVHEYGMSEGLPRQFGGIVVGSNNTVYFLGGSPSMPTSVYKWNLASQGKAEILATSSSLSFPDDIISVPQSITFPTTLGDAYGYYYPPSNAAYKCTTEASPPLLVKAHGGPTACTGISFNAGIQYWTSRGFAVLDVDYGGSTGYGREYRRRLRKSWGIVDIDDVCAGAQFLVEQGLADANRLCIDGGSAGGYTTLGALAFRDVFRAGCSLYGIGDLTALAGDTHKFESRYLDGLVGPYPETKEIYLERSPIESVDSLSCPILLLQGDEDKIVPPNQAETMHQALLKKGIPTCLKIYKGEQHGFRKAENIEDALDSELAFYGRVFGFEVPGGLELHIDNMNKARLS